MNNVLVLLHGWASSGNSEKSLYIADQLQSKGIEVLSPSLPLYDPIATVGDLKFLFDNINDAYNGNYNLIVAGTSLGAWWAELSGLIENCPAVLINPCFNVGSLAKYLGQNTNFVTGETFDFSVANLDKYFSMEKKLREFLSSDFGQQPIHVITATGDDVIPSSLVAAHYGSRITGNGSTLTYYNGGDHRFSDFQYLVNVFDALFSNAS